MIPVLGIPYYNRLDLLRRCLASIDCPVDRLVIVDNSPVGEVTPQTIGDSLEDMPRELRIIKHPNAGVAASWNEIIKLFPAPWWFLANNDIAFGKGDLAAMADAADGKHPLVATGSIGCFYGNHGASAWIVSAYGIEEVGLFDENFYPAYLEDCDWSYRADRLSVPRVNVPHIYMTHGTEKQPGSCTVNASKELQDNCRRTHAGNFEYYRRKWGGNNEQEKFWTPFNIPNWPLAYWRFEPATRARQQWQIET